MLKVGELVTWTSKSDKLFGGYYSANYKSPGIIKEVIKKQITNQSCCGETGHHHNEVYNIYWTDGKLTREHMCYIKRVE